MNIVSYLEYRQNRINTFLLNILPRPDVPPQHLHEAMHYAVLNGGKRLRPILIYATGEAFGIDLETLDYPAGAIELIHAYSLVHDDLPAMDNDDLRRGKPTCHKAFDEATAILVGDALQTLAFDILADNNSFLTPKVRIAMMSCLAKAAGSLGMVGGQALDLRATGQQLNSQELDLIHHLKTGALISASVQLGILASHIDDPSVLNALMTFSNNVGLCFQIQDDILNCEGTTAELGKLVKTDAAKHKATYITIAGIQKAKEALQFFYDQALCALKPLGKNMSTLRALAGYIVKRTY